MVSVEFSIDINFPAALWFWGWLSLLQKWVPGIFPVGKGGRCLGLTTLPPSCADCLEIWEPQPSEALKACPGLQWNCFTFYPLSLRNFMIYFKIRGSSVRIVTSLKAGWYQYRGMNPGTRMRFFTSTRSPNRPWIPRSFLFCGHRALSWEIKRPKREATTHI